jgi:hypothetical protein
MVADVPAGRITEYHHIANARTLAAISNGLQYYQIAIIFASSKGSSYEISPSPATSVIFVSSPFLQ